MQSEADRHAPHPVEVGRFDAHRPRELSLLNERVLEVSLWQTTWRALLYAPCEMMGMRDASRSDRSCTRAVSIQ